MKTTRIMLLAAVLLGALPAMGSAATSISAGLHIGPSGRANVDVGFFYDDLASYGNWVQRPRYGWVWTPRVAVASWRPYQYGHWVWTDLGWTWVSDEPFGWATYHYGRWYDDPDYGWGWVPGDQWAPAWVDWQAGNDYVGWAPLPPSYDYSPGVTVSLNLAPADFIFVPQNRFLETRLVGFVAPRWECDRIYRGTRSFTRYDRFNNQVFNAGFPVDRVQQWTGRRVQRYQVGDLGWNQRHQGGRFAQNRVAFFRPQVERARVAAPSGRPIARRAVLAGAAATAAVRAHHAFRATQTNQVNRQSQAQLRQQQRAQRQTQIQGQALNRQQLRAQGRQQRQQAQQQARLQGQQGRGQRQAQRLQLQQDRQLQRSQRQARTLQLQQGRQQQRLQRQQQQQAQQGRQQMRFQRQQQQQAQQQARQQQRFQRQQQQQAQQQDRQQMRFQRQQQQQSRQQARAQWQQQRPPRQQQQARQQARQQRQGNPGQQGQGRNHGRQRPPQ